jgi:tRNA dimethylallyltransferase
MEEIKLPIIAGITASGKTRLACQIAHKENLIIFGADSRQIYKNMDIGTGKDLADFNEYTPPIDYRLIDYVDPTEEYHVDRYKNDFFQEYNHLKNKEILVCGGSFQYIQSIVKDTIFTQIPKNDNLREQLYSLTKNELLNILNKNTLPFKIDINSSKRIIRGIEIQHFLQDNPLPKSKHPKVKPIYILCYSDAISRKIKITNRLEKRFQEGMIEEVENLIKDGVNSQRLEFFGLEYKYISYYLSGKITYSEMFNKLNTAIHQYAKRQMTWVRKVARENSLHLLLDCSKKNSSEYTLDAIQFIKENTKN